MARRRRLPLVTQLAAKRPDIPDPREAIEQGRVWVAGRVVSNPRSLVAADEPLVVAVQPQPLRGSVKLRAALDAFGVVVAGRTALDVGAAAGGFTTVLVERGARLVYAVDAGHGQLLGSLRQDPRVVNLERTNLARLDREMVPDHIEVITLDLSYLALSEAVPQLRRLAFSPDADLLALVKPMFELGLDAPPGDTALLDEAARRAGAGVAAAGWETRGVVRSPVTGARGAVELLLHAVRGR